MSTGGKSTNIITNKAFACDSHLVAWEYYRIYPEYTGFLDVFRPSMDENATTVYTLIHSIVVPPQPSGMQVLELPNMLPVEAGDVIGMHFPDDGRHFASNIRGTQLYSSEDIEMDDVIICGKLPNLQEGDAIKNTTCSDKPRVYALRAILFQNWTLGMPLILQYIPIKS